MKQQKQQNPNTKTVTALRKPVPCPICQNPSRRESYPFCCRRCADVDLNRWFTGQYAIPTQERASSSLPTDEDES